jgi:HPt (histidine-containing phosphotransfer) domain-containing protein
VAADISNEKPPHLSPSRTAHGNRRAFIHRRDGTDLARTAHALLSSLGAFGAHDAHRLTQRLETQAHQENYEQTDRTFAALERETADIHAALAAFTPAPRAQSRQQEKVKT